ncbi:Lactoylglutathione lyase [Vulgatibacter incomptus]|uniref:Lactoylglutathione lyase n=1 Tax=Vulgatibacter incomptus TaxID=1391653 RepID=A0A0K1PAF9_9BACT|nr:Lactoylglutathione lyase [Vulgatibacter incomptus]
MRLHHLAIQVHDLARAEAFYSDLLGLPVLKRWITGDGSPRATWLGLGGDGFLALERCESPGENDGWSDPLPGFYVLALEIPAGEREVWEAKLARAGHPKVRETAFTFYVRDPDGNRVGLSHHPWERP